MQALPQNYNCMHFVLQLNEVFEVISESRGDYNMVLVKCKLGEEEHLGSGNTIENAKQAAALHVCIVFFNY